MLRPRLCFFAALLALTPLAAAGLAACAALVGFPDRELGDAGRANEAGTIDGADADADADAGPSPFAQLDAGMGCADYPEAGFCDDFQQGLRTDLWTFDRGSGDAGSYTLVQSDPPDGSNAVLELASPTVDPPVTVSLSRQVPTDNPVQRFGFDIFVEQAAVGENVEIGRFQEGDSTLVIYVDGGQLSLQEALGPVDHYATMSLPLQKWTRVEVTLSFVSQPALSLTFDGMPVALNPASPSLGTTWAPGTPSIVIGYAYADMGTAKRLDYDNVTFFSSPE